MSAFPYDLREAPGERLLEDLVFARAPFELAASACAQGVITPTMVQAMAADAYHHTELEHFLTGCLTLAERRGPAHVALIDRWAAWALPGLDWLALPTTNLLSWTLRSGLVQVQRLVAPVLAQLSDAKQRQLVELHVQRNQDGGEGLRHLAQLGGLRFPIPEAPGVNPLLHQSKRADLTATLLALGQNPEAQDLSGKTAGQAILELMQRKLLSLEEGAPVLALLSPQGAQASQAQADRLAFVRLAASKSAAEHWLSYSGIDTRLGIQRQHPAEVLMELDAGATDLAKLRTWAQVLMRAPDPALHTPQASGATPYDWLWFIQVVSAHGPTTQALLKHDPQALAPETVAQRLTRLIAAIDWIQTHVHTQTPSSRVAGVAAILRYFTAQSLASLWAPAQDANQTVLALSTTLLSLFNQASGRLDYKRHDTAAAIGQTVQGIAKQLDVLDAPARAALTCTLEGLAVRAFSDPDRQDLHPLCGLGSPQAPMAYPNAESLASIDLMAEADQWLDPDTMQATQAFGLGVLGLLARLEREQGQVVDWERVCTALEAAAPNASTPPAWTPIVAQQLQAWRLTQTLPASASRGRPRL